MKDERLFGGTMINPFWAKTHLPGLRRPWRLLTVCLAALGLLLALLGPAAAADGALDPSFITGSGQYAGVQTIPEIRGQAGYNTGGLYQGYSILFGTFWGVQVGNTYPPNNGGNSCIARLDNNGALDTTFLINCQINGEIRSVYIYPHTDASFPDYILIGGSFNVSPPGGGNSSYVNFARLKPNGNLDTSLIQPIWWGGAVNAVAVQGSGPSAKILVGGYNLNMGMDGPSYQLIRLDYLGNLDPNYTHWAAPGGYITSIKVFVNDPQYNNDVRIWCSYPKNQNGSGGTYYGLLLDYNAARPDLTAPLWSIGDELVDGPVFNAAQESPGSGGKWIICGQFRNVKNSGVWVPRNRVARLNNDFRTLDTTYDVVGGPNANVTQVSPMNTSGSPSYDDRMVLSGSFTTWNGAACGHLVRLSTTGAVDPSFTPGTAADDRIMKLGWNSNGTGGTIYGYFRSYNGTSNLRGGIAGLDSNGNLNNNFANVTANAGFSGMVYSLATQSDGKIIIGGDFNGVGGKYRPGLARINANGSLDPSFICGVDGVVRSVAVQADGKILLAGQFGQVNGYARTSLARMNPNGGLDTTFNPVLAGGDSSVNQLYHVLPLTNGQMMIAGDIWNNTGSAPVARLNSDGSLDAAFWSNVSNIPNPIPGAEWTWVTRVAEAGSNYVLAGGYENTTVRGGFLGRLTGSGTLDPTFYPNSNSHVQTMDGEVDDLLLQPDGKIVVSGMFTHIIDGSVARSAIARFSANGLLDNTFTPSLTPPNGANTIALAAMARQPNGKILIEANFLNYQGNYNYQYVSGQVARLNPNGSLDSSFSNGSPAGGWFYPGGGNSILRLPTGKALIGGCYQNYGGTQAWSLARIFAGPANFSPGDLLLLLIQ